MTELKVVADDLAVIAINSRRNVSSRKNIKLNASDAYARTALNRYYYASFLLTREFLNSVDSKYREAAHANIPDLIDEKLKKILIKDMNNRITNKKITQQEGKYLQTTIRSLTKQISETMSEGYRTRIVADYQPEIEINFFNNGFKLNELSYHQAKNWPNLIRAACNRLDKIMRELGYI